MQKEREIFWQLLKPEYMGAVMFCRKLTGDRDSADDLMQDTMITALTKFHQLRDHGSFRPWLYRVIVNTFRATVRRPWWKRRVALSPAVTTDLVTPDPADRLDARRWLQRAFQAISAEEQALITLHELEQWTVAELAELYSKSESAIKTRLFRARGRMKKALLRLTRAARVKDGQEFENNGVSDALSPGQT